MASSTEEWGPDKLASESLLNAYFWASTQIHGSGVGPFAIFNKFLEVMPMMPVWNHTVRTTAIERRGHSLAKKSFKV